jgi:hypothetical protein
MDHKERSMSEQESDSSPLTDILGQAFSVIIEDANINRIHEFYDESYREVCNGQVVCNNRLEFRDMLIQRTPGGTVCIIDEKNVETENGVGNLHKLLITDPEGKRQRAQVVSVFTFTAERKINSCTEIVAFEKEEDLPEDEDAFYYE